MCKFWMLLLLRLHFLAIDHWCSLIIWELEWTGLWLCAGYLSLRRVLVSFCMPHKTTCGRVQLYVLFFCGFWSFLQGEHSDLWEELTKPKIFLRAEITCDQTSFSASFIPSFCTTKKECQMEVTRVRDKTQFCYKAN